MNRICFVTCNEIAAIVDGNRSKITQRVKKHVLRCFACRETLMWNINWQSCVSKSEAKAIQKRHDNDHDNNAEPGYIIIGGKKLWKKESQIVSVV